MSVHPTDCSCTRCRGFQPGNTLELKHGAHALVKLAPRAEELAADLRELVPLHSPADEPVIRTFGLVLARLEAASVAFENASPEELKDLDQRARGWTGTVLKYAEALGMTPAARVRLGLDVVRVEALRESMIERLADQGRTLRMAAEGSPVASSDTETASAASGPSDGGEVR